MAIKVLEIHHTGYRLDTGAEKLEDTASFYSDVLGLHRDKGRLTIPGIPGLWINVGEVGQIHLFGGNQPSPVAKGPGQDPTLPHIALAGRRHRREPAGTGAYGREVLGDRRTHQPRFTAALPRRSVRQHGRTAPGR